MTRTTTLLASTLLAVALFGTFPAAAADVRAELTPDLIYDHCLVAGLGSETEGSFMLPDGRRVSGSVLCTAEDLVAAKAKPSPNRDDENGVEGEDDNNHEDDDHDD